MSITDVKVNVPAPRPSRGRVLTQKAEAYLAELDRLNDELEHYQNEEARLTDALNRERNARRLDYAKMQTEINVLREQLAKAEGERDFFHTQAREFIVELRRMESTVDDIFDRVGRVSKLYEANAPNLTARIAAMEHGEEQSGGGENGDTAQPADQVPPNIEQPEQPAGPAPAVPPEAPFGAPGAAGTVDDGAPPPDFLRQVGTNDEQQK